MSKPRYNVIEGLFNNTEEIRIEDLENTGETLKVLRDGPIEGTIGLLDQLATGGAFGREVGLHSLPVDIQALKACMALLLIVSELLPKDSGLGHNCDTAAKVLAIIIKGSVREEDIQELFDVPTDPDKIQ